MNDIYLCVRVYLLDHLWNVAEDHMKNSICIHVYVYMYAYIYLFCMYCIVYMDCMRLCFVYIVYTVHIVLYIWIVCIHRNGGRGSHSICIYTHSFDVYTFVHINNVAYIDLYTRACWCIYTYCTWIFNYTCVVLHARASTCTCCAHGCTTPHASAQNISRALDIYVLVHDILDLYVFSMIYWTYMSLSMIYWTYMSLSMIYASQMCVCVYIHTHMLFTSTAQNVMRDLEKWGLWY